MPDWLQILLTIIITLGIVTILVLIGLKIYRNLDKSGKCNFIQFTPNSSGLGDDKYSQAGYISCSGGGSAWSPKKLNIFNQGSGDFYIGPIQGQNYPVKIESGQYYTYSITGNIEPNIYYIAGSTDISPNFIITVI